MKSERNSASGLTLIEAMVVVAVLTLLLGLFVLPYAARAKGNTSQIRCANQLKSLALCFRQWALDNDDKFPTQVSVTNGGAMEWAKQGIAWPVFDVMSNEINTPKILLCPGDYDTNRFAADRFGLPGSQSSFILFTNNRNLSYFVSLDAIESRTNLLLLGDSHIELRGKALASGLQELNGQQVIGWAAARHKQIGNLAFSDGAVRPCTSKTLPVVFKATGLATSRLALP